MKTTAASLMLASALSGCVEEVGDDGAGGSTSTGPGGGEGGVPAPGTYEDNFVQVARGPGPTFVEILEVRAAPNDQLLYCSAVQGLNALDVSDPQNPVALYRVGSSLGSSQYPRCQHFARTDTALYISNRGDEIQPTPFVTAFDATTSPPTEGASYTESGVSFEGLAAEGNLLYVAAHDDGLRILENDGSALSLRGTVADLTNAWAVEVHQSMVYVADGVGGLAVVDASDPSAATIAGRTTLDGAAQHVALDRDTMLAYVAAGAAGLIVVDVRTPGAPTQIGRVDTPGTALQVALADGRAFVADWNDVRVYDVSDPGTPTLMAVEVIPLSETSRVLGVGAANNLAFAGEWSGLYVYELFPEMSVPQIRLGDGQLDLGAISAGDAQVAAVILENEGPEPLVVTWMEGYGLDLSTEFPFALEAGEKTAVEVTVQGAVGPITASLNVWSDDPDEPESALAVVANTPSLGVGDPAPGAVVQLTTGGNWSLADQLGNIVVMSYFATF